MRVLMGTARPFDTCITQAGSLWISHSNWQCCSAGKSRWSIFQCMFVLYLGTVSHRVKSTKICAPKNTNPHINVNISKHSQVLSVVPILNLIRLPNQNKFTCKFQSWIAQSILELESENNFGGVPPGVQLIPTIENVFTVF